MIHVRIVAHDVGHFFVNDEGDIRSVSMTAQYLQKGRNQHQIA